MVEEEGFKLHNVSNVISFKRILLHSGRGSKTILQVFFLGFKLSFINFTAGISFFENLNGP